VSPVEPEILTQVEDEVLYQEDFAAFGGYYGDAAVLTLPAIAVGEMNVPMYGNDVVSGEGEDVADADVLDIELDFGELFEEVPEPAFDGALSLESAAFRYFTRVDEDAVIPPGRHEFGQVVPVQSLEGAGNGLFSDKRSDHKTLLSESGY
jgi:hypothetical protein